MLIAFLSLLLAVLALRVAMYLGIRGFAAAKRWLHTGPQIPGASVRVKERAYLLKKNTAAARKALLASTKLGWYQMVLIFTVGSVAGLFLEQIWMLITAGLTQSRVGLVWGPFSPLYGFGALFMTLAAYELTRRQASGVVIVLVSAAIGGILEQVTGWGLDTFLHASSWTYAYLPDHITQWVAWRFLAMWGLLGLVWTEYLAPFEL